MSQPFHFRSASRRTWNNFNDCYMLLLTCSRILEYLNAFSSSSLKTGIEIRLWLFLRILAVEVVGLGDLDEQYCVRSDTGLAVQQ